MKSNVNYDCKIPYLFNFQSFRIPSLGSPNEDLRGEIMHIGNNIDIGKLCRHGENYVMKWR